VEALRVYDVNQPPEMQFTEGLGPFDITEGDSLVFDVAAADPDGPDPILDTADIPINATWQLNLTYWGTFKFYPDYSQAGQYFPQFIAIDNEGLADTQVIEINVAGVGNQPPSFTTTLPDTIDVYVDIQHLTDLVAVDPDLDSIVLDAVHSIPVGANFVDNGNGTGTFAYTPEVTEIGSVFQVIFSATDYPAGIADTIITHYRVNTFKRGDTDNDNKYTMNDIVLLINFLFRGSVAPEPLEAGDVDQSGAINVSDVAYLVNFLYNSGPRPPQ
jgi:hypothetical protein